MGNPEQVGVAQQHEHPVEPRHLREFSRSSGTGWPELDWASSDGGPTMTLVRYRRLADAPPPERELLEVDEDGRGAGLAVHGRGDRPVRRGGRRTSTGLRAAVARARPRPTAPDRARRCRRTPPSSARGRRADRAASRRGRRWTGPWARARGARAAGRSTRRWTRPWPRSRASLAADGAVHLEHRGTGSCPWSSGRWRCEVGAAGGTAPRSRRRRVTGRPGSARVDAGPGWALDIAGRRSATRARRRLLVAVASFVAEDGRDLRAGGRSTATACRTDPASPGRRPRRGYAAGQLQVLAELGLDREPPELAVLALGRPDEVGHPDTAGPSAAAR